MKLPLALLTLLSVLSLDARADSSVSYLGVTDVIAPSVPNRTTVTEKQVGMIIYDVDTGQFFGLNKFGNWDALSSASITSRSDVIVDGGAGVGSTNTKIRRFSNTRKNVGSDITYATSTTDGDSFTIETNGTYAISYCDGANSNTTAVGISVNTSAPTSSILTLTYAQGKRMAGYSVNSAPGCVSWTGNLSDGDVVRAHGDGAANFTDSQTIFTISKVGD